MPLDASLHPLVDDKENYVRTLLGMVPDMKGTHTMKIDSLRAFYTRDKVTAATSDQAVDQVVRSFLLYLLWTTLFADAASSSFDWGSCALAFLYRGMDDMVRWARRLYGF